MNRPQISIPRSEAPVSAAGKPSARMGKGFPECRRPRRTRSSWIRDRVRAEPGAGERWARMSGGTRRCYPARAPRARATCRKVSERGTSAADAAPRGAPSARRGRQLQQSLAQHPDLPPRTLRACRSQPYLLHEHIGRHGHQHPELVRQETRTARAVISNP